MTFLTVRVGDQLLLTKEVNVDVATLLSPQADGDPRPVTLLPGSTLGPWAIDGEGALIARVAGIEITAPLVSRYCALFSEEVEANARLIAAAPDLLEACKEALLWSGHDGDHVSDPARALLLSAIAKAESR